MGDTSAVSFEQVLKDELQEIGESRKRRREFGGSGLEAESPPPHESVIPDVPADPDDAYQRAARSELMGLAFSGGGIRSATFNLGILQGLAKHGLLPRFDYLSTVSGGGYIGGWFTAWLKRSNLPDVSAGLSGAHARAGAPEVPQIRFLRAFSNYLTPKLGLLSADTLTVVSIYLRNLLLNLSLVVLGLSAALLAPRLVEAFTKIAQGLPMQTWLAAFALAGALAIYGIGLNLRLMKLAAREAKGSIDRKLKLFTGQIAIQIVVILPIFFLAWLLILPLHRDFTVFRWLVLGVAVGVGPLVAYLHFADKGHWKDGLISAVAAVPSAIAGAALIVLLAGTLRDWSNLAGGDIQWQLLLTVGPPLFLAMLSLGATLYIGLMGQAFDTAHREWWGRLGGWTLAYVAGWVGVFGIAFYGGSALLQAGTWTKTALGSTWCLTTVGGLLAGKSTSTGNNKSRGALELLAKVTPYVFVVGLLAALAALLEWGIGRFELQGALIYSALIVGLLALGGFLSWRFDINEFSLHNFYRNRLVRCYIGASDPDRTPNPFTGFDFREHRFRISDLIVKPAPVDAGDDERMERGGLKESYVGPYPIVNVALNLVAGKNLAWQQRKATSLVFTPKHTGFDVESEREEMGTRGKSRSGDLADNGYRPTPHYDGGMSLGTAMAISGAAASPNMGYHSEPALGFLMTVFNVRLGWWLGNPRHEGSWNLPGPLLGLGYLLTELFGLTNDESRFVYVSDGGHFENLGIYELVKRRCRLIVACDAAQDGEMQFGDLGNAIEKCRTDLAVEIDLAVKPIRPAAAGELSQWHCVVGEIRYPKSASGEPVEPGTLLYIKSSMTGDEPTDVERYAAQNKTFPHQSTADQWFDESQFESYRELGRHIAESSLAKAGASDSMTTEQLILALRGRWTPKSEEDLEAESQVPRAAEKVAGMLS